MRTEMRVDGANCPSCLNTVIDQLRAVPGVHSVEASSSAGCIAIDHDDLDPVELIEVVRAQLRGVAMASAEIVMVSVEPLVTELHCGHGRAAS